MGPVIPALLIKISIFEFFNIFETTFSTSIKFETSTIFELKFLLFSFFSALFIFSSSISQIITLAPDSKKRFAISSPKP